MQTKRKPDDIWTRFALSIFKLNGLIMQVGDSITQPIGQSSARWQVLGRAFEPQTVSQMARDIGHARQSVQRIADVLVKEGLVVYKTHPTDHRTKLLTLTPKGLQVLTTIYKRQVAWSEKMVIKLSPDKLAEVVGLLENIGQKMETEMHVQNENKKKGGDR